LYRRDVSATAIAGDVAVPPRNGRVKSKPALTQAQSDWQFRVWVWPALAAL
jgi:hypothetical protein